MPLGPTTPDLRAGQEGQRDGVQDDLVAVGLPHSAHLVDELGHASRVGASGARIGRTGSPADTVHPGRAPGNASGQAHPVGHPATRAPAHAGQAGAPQPGTPRPVRPRTPVRQAHPSRAPRDPCARARRSGRRTPAGHPATRAPAHAGQAGAPQPGTPRPVRPRTPVRQAHPSRAPGPRRPGTLVRQACLLRPLPRCPRHHPPQVPPRPPHRATRLAPWRTRPRHARRSSRPRPEGHRSQPRSSALRAPARRRVPRPPPAPCLPQPAPGAPPDRAVAADAAPVAGHRVREN